MSIYDFHDFGSRSTERKDLTYQVGYFTHSGFKVKDSYSNLDDANLRCAWLHQFRPLKRHFYTVRFN